MRLILASTSPRRKEILALLGIPFDVVAPRVEERFDRTRSAMEETRHWAAEKVRSVAKGHPDATVIGSDTLIEFDDAKIGKPNDHDDALDILQRLAGREHTVVSSVCVFGSKKIERIETEEVRVRMRRLPDDLLARYAFSDDPLDKAGAYAVQGDGEKLIERIAGDYLAVVGLPLRLVVRLLREEGIVLRADVEAIYRDRNFLNWRRFHP
jgi:septum formation protein